MQDHWVSHFDIPHHLLDAFSQAFEDDPEPVSMDLLEDGEKVVGWRVSRYTGTAPNNRDLLARLAVVAQAHDVAVPSVKVESVAGRDWLAESLQSFTPLRIGRFFIRGSHRNDPAPSGTYLLCIDAATAFGTGEHESTEGCLQAVSALSKNTRFVARVCGGKDPAVLDMGCGTGVLALAALKLWPSVRALAVDIDPLATQAALRHARSNGVFSRLTCRTGAGFRHRDVHKDRTYPLIFANILARPLCTMASDVARHLAPGGRVILAGLLTRQVPMVLAAYRRVGLVLHRAHKGPMWTTLVVGR